MLRGSGGAAGDVVIVGNHRDAWIYGGVDPATGSAAIVELAHASARLHRGGWRPKRGILFASWDAERLALMSSTEWAEEHEEWLRDHAVAYLNVDSAASGSRFVAGAAPSLMRLIAGAADAVRDPASRVSIAATARSRWSIDHGAPVRGSASRSSKIVSGAAPTTPPFSIISRRAGRRPGLRWPAARGHSVHDTHQFVARRGSGVSRHDEPGQSAGSRHCACWMAMRFQSMFRLPPPPFKSTSRKRASAWPEASRRRLPRFEGRRRARTGRSGFQRRAGCGDRVGETQRAG